MKFQDFSLFIIGNKRMGQARSAPDVRLCGDASIKSMLVEPERQLQWIPQRVIETKTVDSLPTSSWEVKVPFTVRFRGPDDLCAILGTIRYNQAFDRSAIKVKDNTFDSLRSLRLFDDYQLSYCLCREHERQACNCNDYQAAHCSNY